VQLAAGLDTPSVGRVTLDDQAPFSHAIVRRRVGALSAIERLPPARRVADALSLALRARGDSRSAASVLDSAALSPLAARRTSDLSTREVRALALVLALTHPEPTLLALFEPCSLIGILSEDFVLQTLARWATAGTIVLASASRNEDAARLGGATAALERGIWLDSPHARPPLGTITLRVRTLEPRRLATLLSEAPEVTAVEPAGGQELLVRGSDLERVAAHVVASARSQAIVIEALRYDPPDLEALAAARSPARHEQARRDAQPLPTNPPKATQVPQ
jgi:ABC-type multidrug transport system ATPase subunit